MLHALRSWVRRNLHGVLGISRIHDENRRIESLLLELLRVSELQYQDLFLMLQRLAPASPMTRLELQTDFPVAQTSDDHKFPRGTIHDNTRSLRFVTACERHFQRPLKVLDLGCAGGGMVLDFVLRGHLAVGLEGSDVSQRMQRATWRLLPDNLFTCDITKAFQLRTADQHEAMDFDVITMWEVLEHIPEESLAHVFENTTRHLHPGGFFVGSVSTLPQVDPATGADYHVTVHPKSWWEQRMNDAGLALTENHPFLSGDYCRGSGNGMNDIDLTQEPEAGFHFVAHCI